MPNSEALRNKLLLTACVWPVHRVVFDGYYNRKAESLDMQGVLSPIYFINGIGSALTRKGDGLFGFSFKLDGKKGQPSLEVNPLSILTPGIFRDVFRRLPQA